MNNSKNYTRILLRGTIAVSLANASSQLASILLLPFFTNYLSPEEYGIASLVSLIITFFALLYNPGMISATARLYHSTEDEKERKTLIGSAHKFFLIIPLLPILISLFFGEAICSYIFSNFNFYPYGFLALLLAYFIQPSSIWSTLMALQYKVHRTAVLTAISVILGLLVSIILVAGFKMGIMGKILGMFIPAIFIFVVSLISIKEYTKGDWSFDSIKRQLLFGFPLILALWAYQGLNFIGKYLLENLSTLKSLGIYSFGGTLASIPLILVLGFKQLWNPIFYENMNNKNYIVISKLITYFIATISILSLLFILFFKEFIILFINERYYSVIPIIGILVLGVYFNGLLTISNSVLSYNNQFGKISIYGALASIVNLLFNLILIPKLDILGASISLAISYFIFFLLGAISQRETLRKFQSNSVGIIPTITLIGGVVLTYSISTFYSEKNVYFIEILLKLLYFFNVLFVFFKIKLINASSILVIMNFLKIKLSRKSIVI